MKFYIQTINNNGSGMKYNTKEDCLREIGLMIDDCIANGGTFISFDVDADASCFCANEDDEEETEEEIEARNKKNEAFSAIVKDKRRKCPHGYWRVWVARNTYKKLSLDDVDPTKDFGGYYCEIRKTTVTPHECSICKDFTN